MQPQTKPVPSDLMKREIDEAAMAGLGGGRRKNSEGSQELCKLRNAHRRAQLSCLLASLPVQYQRGESPAAGASAKDGSLAVN